MTTLTESTEDSYMRILPELQSGGRHAIDHGVDAERWPDLKARATALRLAPGASSTPSGPGESSAGVGPTGAGPEGSNGDNA